MARILVTGASTGLGLLTAVSLADAGHQVVLHARCADRVDGMSAVSRMLGTVLGDLADHDQTVDIAAQAGRFGRFDAMIHNAGVADGADVPAVNVVAPFALTALMEPPPRIIVLSSSLHRGGSAAEPAARIMAGELDYSSSKLLVTAFAMGLARRWPGTMVHAVDPGWVPTRMGGPSATDDLAEGHRTQEWLATAPEAEIRPKTGGYWYHRASSRPHPATLDTAVQDEVIRALEQCTGLRLP